MYITISRYATSNINLVILSIFGFSKTLIWSGLAQGVEFNEKIDSKRRAIEGASNYFHHETMVDDDATDNDADGDDDEMKNWFWYVKKKKKRNWTCKLLPTKNL